MNAVLASAGPFLGGILFSLGLGISGMTEPSKIIAFLDLFGNWNPSLIFVMIGAIAVNAALHPLIMKKAAPVFDSQFYLPKKLNLDRRLVIGSTLFGLGWGITGLCPGPGVVALTSGSQYSFTFVLAMIVGMVLTQKFDRYYSRKR